jgi:hypothetical protein
MVARFGNLEAVFKKVMREGREKVRDGSIWS